jgi:hypothetical protein
MPGADGNEDTGYVHSVYRSGDQSIILRPSLYPYDFMHLLFILIILSYRRASKQSPEAIAENVMQLLQLARELDASHEKNTFNTVRLGALLDFPKRQAKS